MAPQGGIYKSWGGGDTEHLGNWGGMDPFGGNQQIAQDVLLAGVLCMAASLVFVDVT